MQPERKRRAQDAQKVVSIKRTNDLVWKGAEYPMLAPGLYTVRGIKTQGPEWVRNFFRWSLRVEFGLTTESLSISAFFNFGNDPEGPKIARMSRFYKAWVLANGGQPAKGETMSPDVFLDGQFFEVEVADCNRDSEGNPKPGAENYSRIVRILSVTRP